MTSTRPIQYTFGILSSLPLPHFIRNQQGHSKTQLKQGVALLRISPSLKPIWLSHPFGRLPQRSNLTHRCLAHDGLLLGSAGAVRNLLHRGTSAGSALFVLDREDFDSSTRASLF